MITLAYTISQLYPDADWVLEGFDYSGLKWKSTDIPKPTQLELETEQARLQAEYDAKGYARNRAPEYPSLGDQLDDLFHNGMFSEEMRAKIQAVKNKYPKS
jgi:hypothetical protein